MAYKNQATRALTSQLRLKGGVEILALSGDINLDRSSANVLRIDPGGAGRTVTLPPAGESDGLAFDILNAADAAETLTVVDSTGTIVSIAQNRAAKVVSDGSVWTHMGIRTVTL